MARIAGVDLPRDKRTEIALTYIYGIGLTSSQEILKMTGVDPSIRIRDLDEAQVARLREVIERNYRVEGDLRREISDEHQAPAGNRQLSWPAPSPQSAGARPAHAHQCPHEAWRPQDGARKEARSEVSLREYKECRNQQQQQPAGRRPGARGGGGRGVSGGWCRRGRCTFSRRSTTRSSR